MDFSTIIGYIKAQVDKYTGNDTLYFGFGTMKELNSSSDRKFPLVWVLTDPEMVNINEVAESVESYQFPFLVVDKIELADQEPAINAAYSDTKLIGDGIVFGLRQGEDVAVQSVQKTLKLKQADDNLTGVAYLLTLHVPNLDCAPFDYE